MTPTPLVHGRGASRPLSFPHVPFRARGEGGQTYEEWYNAAHTCSVNETIAAPGPKDEKNLTIYLSLLIYIDNINNLYISKYLSTD